VGLNPPPQRQANIRQLGADRIAILRWNYQPTPSHSGRDFQHTWGGITNPPPHVWGGISNTHARTHTHTHTPRIKIENTSNI